MSIFRDRSEAGRQLGVRLAQRGGADQPAVLALPRGGVPVGFEVARALAAPLDVFVVRKLGVPGHDELAMGAIATGGAWVVNEPVVRKLDITREQLAAVIARERAELIRREEAYRAGREALDVQALTVLLVDDGLATGATMRAAAAAVRRRRPRRLVVAVPVAPPDTCTALAEVADDVVCLVTPEPFYAVGAWYEDFAAPTDEDVRELLRRAAGELGPRQG